MDFSRQRSWRELAVLGSTLGLVVAAAPALADDEGAPAAAQTQANEPPALVLGNAAPIADEVLRTETAKAQIEIDKLVVNDQDLNGVVQGNAAINTQSGNNDVSGNAFQDTAGFVTVIQNTGNNVLIQNSTIVNIALEP